MQQINIQNYDNVGLFIKKKRETIFPQFSLNEFALHSGVDSSTLSKIENKKQGMNIKTAIKISASFGMLLSEFWQEYEQSEMFK